MLDISVVFSKLSVSREGTVLAAMQICHISSTGLLAKLH